MSTRPTGDCTSTTCQRAPSWLWTTLLHQVCWSYTYPVEDGAALTLKKKFWLDEHHIFLYEESCPVFRPASYCMALQIWSVQKVCWWWDAMQGSTFSCPKPGTESMCRAGGSCRPGLHVGNFSWCLRVGWTKNTEKNFLIPEGDQCHFLKQKTVCLFKY